MLPIIWFLGVLFAYAHNPEAIMTLLQNEWLLFILITILSVVIKPSIEIKHVVQMVMSGKYEVVHMEVNQGQPSLVSQQRPAEADAGRNARSPFGFLDTEGKERE